ncbi:MAG: amidase [Candidatus Promineifilaceae bacterium]|nr:amidase [Candidatus Promineifilaceae bacterium]
MQELTIAEIQRRMKGGTLTARELTASYLERIEQIDRNGPQLNSVIEVNPDAQEIAERLDEERAARGARSPLHGIPILLKENIATADQMQTTAGSLALEGVRAEDDAFLVRRLRAAGAVILGKANLSEWANFRSTRSSSGWSSRGGQTRNPYALDRNPCGSSSGSAVAVAADLCAGAVGTETDGSIICPAQANGVVGLKPTVGLVSRRGIVPISHSQDTAGPLARTVAGCAFLLGGMVAHDPEDGATEGSAERGERDYSQFLDTDGLRGTRIGVARQFFGFHDRVDRLMERAIEAMRDQGAEIVDPVQVEQADALGETEIEVLLYEFKHSINDYLSRLESDAAVHSLEELIAFNREHAAQTMPYFRQELFEKAQAKGPLTESAYQEARARSRRLAREGIDETIAAHKLDAIVAPSGGPAWLTDWINGDHFGGGSSRPAAVAGYPAITVPAGDIFGLPVGISFFAGAYQEPTLLRLAHAYEQATRLRRPPDYRSTVDFS